jgi:hypothetical protein
MNEHEDRYKLLVRLRKYGEFWRMDASDYRKFINYIKHYFRECECKPEAMSGNVLYADLSEDDLKVIGSYYGIYSPDKDTLLLAEVYSGFFDLYRGNPFTIRLCIKTNLEQDSFVLAKMILK